MQQGKINYKEDGINNTKEKLDIISIDDKTYENTEIINVEMK